MRGFLRIALYTAIVVGIAGVAVSRLHYQPASADLPLCSATLVNTANCEVDLTGSFAFNPSTFTVAQDIQHPVTVTFKNVSSGIPHTSTSDPSDTGDSWNSGTLSPGQSFDHPFTTLGTFPFYCQFHGNLLTSPPSGMVGTVDVVAPASAQVPIATGWSLVDHPVASATAVTASALAGSLNSSLGSAATGAVATYGNGGFHVFAPGFSSDFPVNDSSGIFTLTSAAGTWNVSGYGYASGATVPLVPGWNLVGVPFPAAGISASSIQSEASACDVQQIATYAGGYSVWKPGDSDKTISSKSGVWILCTGADNWKPS